MGWSVEPLEYCRGVSDFSFQKSDRRRIWPDLHPQIQPKLDPEPETDMGDNCYI